MLQTTEQIVSSEAERYMLVYMISAMMIITVMVIAFFVVFQKRKNKILLSKFEQQRAFEEELTKTQLEIQEQTLKNVGRELHDNVGQMLAYSNMQLNALGATVNEEIKPNIESIQSVIKESIEEVRGLSKTLNSDVSLKLGLVDSLKNEVNRINRLNSIKAKFTSSGNQQSINNQNDEIFIYRILQEFFSNTIKYSEAETISISLNYNKDSLNIEVLDNGKGFNFESIEIGSGLINMKSRAELIGAEIDIRSKLNEGTSLSLNYPFKSI
ncbi:sensor histidine kinase [Ichthyenterobacterium sp. W332]|uniref:histidine kinase n=1 Tax=Microcosmobacter mediterraneus TaxID=3075607 RepID=A0ABU2YKS2_9FLAO|nr:sensor histidine kinase [Ichthyenterobacterium sp. W332]MDT0558772.1 sensor histidine kinase [Ichthyenterobacterium sp. W332]